MMFIYKTRPRSTKFTFMLYQMIHELFDVHTRVRKAACLSKSLSNSLYVATLLTATLK